MLAYPWRGFTGSEDLPAVVGTAGASHIALVASKRSVPGQPVGKVSRRICMCFRGKQEACEIPLAIVICMATWGREGGLPPWWVPEFTHHTGSPPQSKASM